MPVTVFNWTRECVVLNLFKKIVNRSCSPEGGCRGSGIFSETPDIINQSPGQWEQIAELTTFILQLPQGTGYATTGYSSRLINILHHDLCSTFTIHEEEKPYPIILYIRWECVLWTRLQWMPFLCTLLAINTCMFCTLQCYLLRSIIIAYNCIHFPMVKKFYVSTFAIKKFQSHNTNYICR